MEKQRTTLGFNGITTKDDPDEKVITLCFKIYYQLLI